MAMGVIVKVFLSSIVVTVVRRMPVLRVTRAVLMLLLAAIAVLRLAFAFASRAILHCDTLVVMMRYHHVNENKQKGQQKRYGYYLVFHDGQR